MVQDIFHLLIGSPPVGYEFIEYIGGIVIVIMVIRAFQSIFAIPLKRKERR
jgi:hypothetical protein